MIKAFAPARFSEALRHVRATDAESAMVVAELSRMERDLRRPSQALAVIRSGQGASAAAGP
ncbi:hypothetical protein D3C83_289210 [compost metagenome]